MDKTTEQLLNEIMDSSDILDFIDKNEGEFANETAREFITRKLSEQGMTVGDVVSASDHGSYIYKVFGGSRPPRRNILICIALGMKLSVRDAQRLLRLSGTAPLDPRVRRDAAAIYALAHELGERYLNDMLFEIQEESF